VVPKTANAAIGFDRDSALTGDEPRTRRCRTPSAGRSAKRVTPSMEKIFEADNRKADEWWANAKGLRLIHRRQVPGGFRSNPSKRLLIAINLQRRSVAFLSGMRTLVSFVDPHSSEIDFCTGPPQVVISF
jgi:hypothetical protein